MNIVNFFSVKNLIIAISIFILSLLTFGLVFLFIKKSKNR